MKLQALFTIIILIFLSILLFIFTNRGDLLVLLNPKGFIALYERNLMVVTFGIMLCAAIPGLLLAFFVAFKYKESKKNPRKAEEFKDTTFLTFIKWLIPFNLILLLMVINWMGTHDLDPYKPIASSQKPLSVQVIALRWKWVFIYPKEQIATVNFLAIPEKTPIVFDLTADGPMSSFWIPALSGQIYAMSGMNARINMLANSIGEFEGSSAEVNGRGFSGMRFKVKAIRSADFDKWVENVKKIKKTLSFAEYDVLSTPSEDNPVVIYSSIQKNLYNEIIGKYNEVKVNQEMEGMHK